MSVNLVVQNDTATTLQATCTNVDGTVIDLTNASVAIEWTVNGGSLVSKTMTVTSPTTGVAAYTFATGDLASPGLLLYRVVITFADSSILTSPQSGSLKIVKVL